MLPCVEAADDRRVDEGRTPNRQPVQPDQGEARADGSDGGGAPDVQ